MLVGAPAAANARGAFGTIQALLAHLVGYSCCRLSRKMADFAAGNKDRDRIAIVRIIWLSCNNSVDLKVGAIPTVFAADRN